MKNLNLTSTIALRVILVVAVILATAIMFLPERADAARVMRSRIKGPIVTISSARTVPGSCGCCDAPRRVIVSSGGERSLRQVRYVEPTCHRAERRRHRAAERVWVPGHWVPTGARMSRWMPGHWARA